jgi:ElaB/YqjD/DUF883 family membrane-anchored ribosome-binding protein
MDARKNLHEAKGDLHKASEHIVDATNEVKKQAQECSEELVEYIKESPIKSVLIASAIGMLIGKLFL